ncbi:MAG: pirin family protein [Oscillatoria sp. PMC 1051.18]|nr:pirin family protein [Oscillatoria sp. PMC 1050.18]MEC5032885.1 pirin family protein [Oscillatoria sp. PMC 1051.18]
MITLRKSTERGNANLGWLNSFHTFSFANYYDPKHMGFQQLRVINEDKIQPGRGFGAHSHRDMEIISYVIAGALEHKDSMGNSSIIRPGEVQIMSAGTGVTHSEYNPSNTELVHLLQIWILPDRAKVEPRYAQKMYPDEERQGKLRLVVSADGRDDSLMIHQDANIYASLLAAGEQIEYQLSPNRHAWLQVVKGELNLNDVTVAAGDGVAVSDTDKLTLRANQDAELLLFDLA